MKRSALAWLSLCWSLRTFASPEEALRRYLDLSQAARIEDERMTQLGSWPRNRRLAPLAETRMTPLADSTPRQRAEWYLRESRVSDLSVADLKRIEDASLLDDVLGREFDRFLTNAFGRPLTLEKDLDLFAKRLRAVSRPELAQTMRAATWSYVRQGRSTIFEADPRGAAFVKFRRGLIQAPGLRLGSWLRARADLRKNEYIFRQELGDLEVELMSFLMRAWPSDESMVRALVNLRDPVLVEEALNAAPAWVESWMSEGRTGAASEVLAWILRHRLERGEGVAHESLTQLARLHSAINRHEMAANFLQEALRRAGRESGAQTEIFSALSEVSERLADQARTPTDRHRYLAWSLEYLRRVLDGPALYRSRDGLAERYAFGLIELGRLDEGVQVFEQIYVNSTSTEVKVRSLGYAADTLRRSLLSGSLREGSLQRRSLERWMEKVGFLARLAPQRAELREHARDLESWMNRRRISSTDPLRASLAEIREAMSSVRSRAR